MQGQSYAGQSLHPFLMDQSLLNVSETAPLRYGNKGRLVIPIRVAQLLEKGMAIVKKSALLHRSPSIFVKLPRAYLPA